MIMALLSLVVLLRAVAQQIEVATKVMSQTEGPTVDREGNVYFTEASKRIMKLSKNGVLSIYRDDSNCAVGSVRE